MIVLEGTPGGGKTTLIKRLEVNQRHRIKVFPEAQPPPGTDDPEAAEHLLLEDLVRTRFAAGAASDTIVISDRCHIGVLAYRTALTTTLRRPRSELDYARRRVDELRLWQAHSGDHIVVVVIDPAESIRRRAAHRSDPRYRVWFDPAFLAAYNKAMRELAAYCSATIVTDATDLVAAWVGVDRDQLISDGSISPASPFTRTTKAELT